MADKKSGEGKKAAGKGKSGSAKTAPLSKPSSSGGPKKDGKKEDAKKERARKEGAAMAGTVVTSVMRQLAKHPEKRTAALKAVMEGREGAAEVGEMLGHLSARHREALRQTLSRAAHYATWETKTGLSEPLRALGALMRNQLEASARLLIETTQEATNAEFQAAQSTEIYDDLPFTSDIRTSLEISPEEESGRTALDASATPLPPQDEDDD